MFYIALENANRKGVVENVLSLLSIELCLTILKYLDFNFTSL